MQLPEREQIMDYFCRYRYTLRHGHFHRFIRSSSVCIQSASWPGTQRYFRIRGIHHIRSRQFRFSVFRTCRHTIRSNFCSYYIRSSLNYPPSTSDFSFIHPSSTFSSSFSPSAGSLDGPLSHPMHSVTSSSGFLLQRLSHIVRSSFPQCHLFPRVYLFRSKSHVIHRWLSFALRKLFTLSTVDVTSQFHARLLSLLFL